MRASPLALPLLLACGGAVLPAKDSAPGDSGLPDSGLPDSGLPDSGDDSGDDSGLPDSGDDSGLPDSGDDTGTPCAGQAWFTDEAGARREVSAQLAGTADAPVALTWTEPGTLELCAGTWYARLRVEAGVALRLRGAGMEATTLDGRLAGTLLNVQEGAVVEVEGLTLTGGTTGLKSDGAVTVTLTEVRLTGNTATSTAATGVRMAGSLRMVRAELVDNAARASASSSTTCTGGGMHLTGDLTLEDSLIARNTLACAVSGPTYTASVGYGGGAFVTGDVTAIRSEIRDNALSLPTAGGYAGGQGAGLVVGGALTAVDSRITGNTLSVSLACGSANDCTLSAGGAGAVASEATLHNTTVEGNRLTASHQQYSSLPATTRARGGGLHVSGDLTLSLSRVADNLVDASGSNADSVEALGGGVYWDGAGATLQAVDADLGRTGQDDNAPHDLAGAARHDAEGVTSFTCEAATGLCQ